MKLCVSLNTEKEFQSSEDSGELHLDKDRQQTDQGWSPQKGKQNNPGRA